MMRPVTPRGFRDVLPAEAIEREVVARRIADTFASWGYGLIETPIVERLDTLEAAVGDLEGTAFRLIDLDGRLLALRPDMTVPIARLIAQRLAEEAGPHRLRYASEVFREHESLRGQARQFTQAGVELVGASGPAADAEIVALAVETLRAAGVARFTVAVGTVAVLNALLEASGMPKDWCDAVLAAAHERNLVEGDRLSQEAGVPRAVGEALRAVPRIRGGAEAVELCRGAVEACGCSAVLDDLAATLELLAAAGVAGDVSVDFSLVRDFGYYTGMVLEAYAPGLGLPLGGGGRYDGVLSAFEAPAPAAGFALGLDRLMIALAEQGVRVDAPAAATLVGGPAGAAFARAAELRREGRAVRLAPGMEGETLESAARVLGAEWVEAR